MPIQMPNFQGDDDAAKRAQFVSWVLETLDDLVIGADKEYQNLFVPRLVRPMRNAWNEAGRFPGLADLIANIGPDQVTIHGVGGSQLELKLATVNYWVERFVANQNANVMGSWSILRRIFDAIDTLLGSLLSAAPGAGTALEELKEAIRNSMNRGNDD